MNCDNAPVICQHCGHEPGDHGDPDDLCRCCATNGEHAADEAEALASIGRVS